MRQVPSISVCICTYQRPELLATLLEGIAAQETENRFTFDVVVADNDSSQSARPLIAHLAQTFPIPLRYEVEPRRSIAHVRNKTISSSEGELIAFVDDDEYVGSRWLLSLFLALESHPCSGVLGPVRPFYPVGTPAWVRRAGFFERPEHSTGHEMRWAMCRTGNVLFRREIISGCPEPFAAEFGTGGSDVDFFRRMIAAGHRFIWCNEAAVHEVVPPSRWKRRVLFRRALLRGQNSFRHPEHRLSGVLKAAAAIPSYGLALPFLAIVGHHLFMRYFVKLGDHSGRLLAALGVNLIKSRDM